MRERENISGDLVSLGVGSGSQKYLVIRNCRDCQEFRDSRDLHNYLGQNMEQSNSEIRDGYNILLRNIISEIPLLRILVYVIFENSESLDNLELRDIFRIAPPVTWNSLRND